MKEREHWNTFFAVEKDISCNSRMQAAKALAGQYLADASTKRRPALSFGALIRKQLLFTVWKIWFLQGMVLAALCSVFLCLYGENALDWFSTTLPEFLCLCSGVVVLSAVPLLQRSFRYRMMELEQSTRFSVTGSLAAQLIFIGIGDLTMLAVLALIVRQYGLTGSVIFISLVIPFLTTAATSLMLWIRTSPSAFERRSVLLCLLTTLSMLRVVNRYKNSLQSGGLWFWWLYALFCLGILYRAYRKLKSVSYTEKLLRPF